MELLMLILIAVAAIGIIRAIDNNTKALDRLNMTIKNYDQFPKYNV